VKKSIFIMIIGVMAAFGSGCELLENLFVKPETEYFFLNKQISRERELFEFVGINKVETPRDLVGQDYLGILSESLVLIRDEKVRVEGLAMALAALDGVEKKLVDDDSRKLFVEIKGRVLKLQQEYSLAGLLKLELEIERFKVMVLKNLMIENEKSEN